MPRKQKSPPVQKEYGVKSSKHHMSNTSFVENQIVQINLPKDTLDDSSKLMDYNPDLSEPKGLEADGLSEFELLNDTSEQTKKTEKQPWNQKMEERNTQIEQELKKHQEKYETVKQKQLLQWVDLQHSQAYIQDMSSWPNVQYPCHWCLEKCNNISWPLVVGRSKSGCFKVRGHHCSPNCALANGLDSRELSETISVSELYSWMQAFVYKVTGSYDEIRPAPPRLMLEKFGGILSIEKFRKESAMKDYSSYLTYPPLETSLPVWNRIKTSQNEMDNEDNELVLKRSKPFYDTSQSLDSMWRIQ